MGDPSSADVIEQLKKVPIELAPSWKEALRAVTSQVVQKVLPPQNIETWPAAAQAIAADAWGWHSLLSASTVAPLLKSPECAVRFSIARNRHGGDALSKDPDPLVRRAALWSLAQGNPAAALERSRQALRNGEMDPFALRVVGLFGQSVDGRLLVTALGNGSVTIPALWSLRDLAHSEFADAVADLTDSKIEEVASSATDILRSLVGALPPGDSKQGVPEGISPSRHRWRQARAKLDLTGRKLEGQPFPWSGEAADEPMESVWRRALTSSTADTAWIRREVPDGFFAGNALAPALPGE
jgi:hypothetical protein